LAELNELEKKELRMILRLSNNRILNAIFKNPKKSDRQIAKAIGMSQPTVTRTRTKFLGMRFFKYAVIPNLTKFRYKVVAWSQVPFFNISLSDVMNKEVMLKKLKEDDRIIFAMEGMFKVIIVLSKHKSYQDYCDFCRQYAILETVSTTPRGILKPITFNKP